MIEKEIVGLKGAFEEEKIEIEGGGAERILSYE